MSCIGPGVYSTATSCRYKHKELSCAVGSLMSLDEYRPWFEGKTWGTLVEAGLVPSAHADLLQELANVHDNADDIEWCADVMYGLRTAARMRGLSCE